jgi:hypothetical protein
MIELGRWLLRLVSWKFLIKIKFHLRILSIRVLFRLGFFSFLFQSHLSFIVCLNDSDLLELLFEVLNVPTLRKALQLFFPLLGEVRQEGPFTIFLY